MQLSERVIVRTRRTGSRVRLGAFEGVGRFARIDADSLRAKVLAVVLIAGGVRVLVIPYPVVSKGCINRREGAAACSGSDRFR